MSQDYITQGSIMGSSELTKSTLTLRARAQYREATQPRMLVRNDEKQLKRACSGDGLPWRQATLPRTYAKSSAMVVNYHYIWVLLHVQERPRSIEQNAFGKFYWRKRA